MRKSTVMREAKDPPIELPKYVQIRRLGGQRHCRGRQRSLAIQSSPTQAGAGQKVSNGFQSLVKLLFPARVRENT